ALIVMSEEAPLAAFERILRRCAYALLPLSIVFIQYFPHIGRAYGRWDGLEMWTGVTTQKNNLGALCAISMVALVMGLWRKRLAPATAPPKLHRYADIPILVAALVLLGGAGKGTYSATAIAVPLLGMFI